MKLLKSNSGKLSTKIVNSAVLFIIILVILFASYAAIIPEAQSGGDLLGDSARCSAAGGFFNATQAPNCFVNASIEGQINPINFSPVPLASLFGSTGVVFVIVIAALLVIVIKSLLSSK